MRYSPVYIHFNNPICPYSYNICLAEAKYRCLPILADNLAEYQKQALLRANNCNYLGVALSEKEMVHRLMLEKRANKYPYLMR